MTRAPDPSSMATLRSLLFLLWLEPLLLPPRLEESGEFEIAAARDLLMPFLRSPSYCLSFFTLDPWSLATASSDLASGQSDGYPVAKAAKARAPARDRRAAKAHRSPWPQRSRPRFKLAAGDPPALT